MSARLLASSVLSALLMVGSAAANPIVVQPSVIDANDVALYERFPNDNLSGGVANPLLQGFTSLLVVSDTSGSGDFQSLLEFDLADLAGVDPADLVSATVSLYAIDSTQFGFPTASPSTATPIDVTLFDAPTGFDQTTATWNNSPYTRTAGSNLPTTTAYDTTVIDGIDQWFDFDATAALLAALQTSADATAFVLASPAVVSNPTSGNEVSLFAYAAESSTIPPAAGLQPKLTVTLVPEPTALGLLLGFGSLALRQRSFQNR